MKAVKILSPGRALVVTDAIPPKPSPTDLLIKVIAVALNPTDWKHIEFGIPATVGCDFAGVVEEVGSAVTRPFKKGDRIWSAVAGSNKLRPDNGAFSEYLVVKSGLVMKIPEGASFEDAATGGVGVMTVGQGMYQQWEEVPWPDKPMKERVPLLIWGGSSATGALGVQFGKLSGFEVITTCGKHNFDYVKSLGADAVFDSRSPTVGADIRAYTNDKLYYAWDCIGEHGSPDAIAAALASSKPEGQKLRHGTIMFRPGTKVHRDDATFTWSIAYTTHGEVVDTMGLKVPAKPEDYAFAVKWTEMVERLYVEGRFRMHRVEVREGGLEGVLGGLKDMKDGNVSGVKLMYRIADP
ncbi:putative zinc-binding oxidoreductase ToxD [Lentithecium fluviatile CBS 122367]|uniref:Putative zinc-binding oxidoreductase ToxD n=1 Tax=Lentithecium fluviatile CBS 122367 TaxID=1168545 RepID=A0A6G1IHZ7_9PLEO|nr:putative zinc-binding oxidoreductase ToxD [Lentithecium fluviatile CBS 122367]